jgi:predicted ATPase
MLRQLRIQNFKIWKDTGSIRMAPITLFFGENSSGKSSIGQFLMMLKQTVESADRKAVFYPGGKNSAVQLGSYQEMVFHRNPLCQYP